MAKEQINTLLHIMEQLRSDCPWDAEQTHDSLKPYLLEEAYEVLETIDDKNWDLLARELGDLLLQIVFHSQIASESGHFVFDDVVEHISKKLVERHPHVFADKKKFSAEQVQNNWEHSKLKSENRKSILDGLPKSMPALLNAQRMQEKAAAVGFEWDNIKPVFSKVEEEWGEFKEAFEKDDNAAMTDEFGDILFAFVNLGRFLQINSEDALRLASAKFSRRFQAIEQHFNYDSKSMQEASLEELDRYWDEAKKQE